MTLLPSRAICGSATERICQKVSEFNPGLAANSAAEAKRSKLSVRMAVQYTTAGALLQTLKVAPPPSSAVRKPIAKKAYRKQKTLCNFGAAVPSPALSA